MSARSLLTGYAAALVVVGAATAVSYYAFGHEQLADVVMIYLLGVVVVAMRYGYGASLAVAVSSVLCVDYFFVPPYFSFAVAELRHIVTFSVLLIVAVVISHLTKRVRDQADERVRLAEIARRAQLRVESEQHRNALLSAVSHDLRTPLAVITGATSALLDPNAPTDEAARRELLETAHEESLRLNRLVNDLLDMARVEAGALGVKKEPQPLEEVVGSALDRMDDRLRGRAVTTTIPDDLPLVPIDPVLIEQVLINLLENATKYTPAGSPIDVSARATDGVVEVAIADRGSGVAPADAERVFDKFYRVRQGEGGGAGLGLTICRGIATAHGGRIWVEDRPGGGAFFRFTLPLDAQAIGALPPVEGDARDAREEKP